MTPNESEPPKNNRDTSSDSKPRKRSSGNWTPTPEALDKLLESLSPDRDEAGKEYVALRNKLSRFFERRHCDSADTLVDDVIELVMRKIDQGQQIENVSAYAHKVALYKYYERIKDPEPVEIDWDHIPAPDPKPDLDDEDQRRQDCFDMCLAKLPGEIRDLILAYHREQGHANIELRRKLAAKMKIPINALRIRAHRIRVGLEACIEECLSQHALSEM
jgi:DNA-directed RNA polymerase specialized sigma24 family protein